METEYVELALATAIAQAGLPADVTEIAQSDPRLGGVLKRGMDEVQGKSVIVHRLKVNSIVNWYVRILAKEVKAVS